MEWISVKEKLPDNNQNIKFNGTFPFKGEGFFLKYLDGYDFFHISSNRIFQVYGVTHWMPLPEPPKE